MRARCVRRRRAVTSNDSGKQRPVGKKKRPSARIGHKTSDVGDGKWEAGGGRWEMGDGTWEIPDSFRWKRGWSTPGSFQWERMGRNMSKVDGGTDAFDWLVNLASLARQILARQSSPPPTFIVVDQAGDPLWPSRPIFSATRCPPSVHAILPLDTSYTTSSVTSEAQTKWGRSETRMPCLTKNALEKLHKSPSCQSTVGRPHKIADFEFGCLIGERQHRGLSPVDPTPTEGPDYPQNNHHTSRFTILPSFAQLTSGLPPVDSAPAEGPDYPRNNYLRPLRPLIVPNNVESPLNPNQTGSAPQQSIAAGSNTLAPDAAPQIETVTAIEPQTSVEEHKEIVYHHRISSPSPQAPLSGGALRGDYRFVFVSVPGGNDGLCTFHVFAALKFEGVYYLRLAVGVILLGSISTTQYTSARFHSQVRESCAFGPLEPSPRAVDHSACNKFDRVLQRHVIENKPIHSVARLITSCRRRTGKKNKHTESRQTVDGKKWKQMLGRHTVEGGKSGRGLLGLTHRKAGPSTVTA
ncbi:hypothetical protein BV25DRAFT_1842457 [Artomyces pyxidatus]|uniref:Uncharacterized protein n=1 Tax=Artomyces pyxidatus TaxID=48021 RepID=A0ACB8SIU2_9AGAM|nr:hypothetical protein BV25DRAFT_1842457 [Artomyces pyxidatus]